MCYVMVFEVRVSGMKVLDMQWIILLANDGYTIYYRLSHVQGVELGVVC